VKDCFQWVKDNFDVLFSGIGVFIISVIGSVLGWIVFRKKNPDNQVKQENIVAGGDVTGRDKKG